MRRIIWWFSSVEFLCCTQSKSAKFICSLYFQEKANLQPWVVSVSRLCYAWRKHFLVVAAPPRASYHYIVSCAICDTHFLPRQIPSVGSSRCVFCWLIFPPSLRCPLLRNFINPFWQRVVRYKDGYRQGWVFWISMQSCLTGEYHIKRLDHDALLATLFVVNHAGTRFWHER